MNSPIPTTLCLATAIGFLALTAQANAASTSSESTLDSTVDTRHPMLTDVVLDQILSTGSLEVTYVVTGSVYIPPTIAALEYSTDTGLTWSTAHTYSDHPPSSVEDGRKLVWNAATDIGIQTGPTSMMVRITITAAGFDETATSSEIAVASLRATQSVHLCFDEDSPFSLFLRPRGIYPVVATSTFASVTSDNQTNILNLLQGIFTRAGIPSHRLAISIDAPAEDAINVFFCIRPLSLAARDMLGYAFPPSRCGMDRFNFVPGGIVIIYYDGSLELDDSRRHPNLIAETTAHEIGHQLGLYHIKPDVSCDLSIMDYNRCNAAPWTLVNFYDLPTPRWNFDGDVTVNGASDTHNPLYHLQRWTGGIAEDLARAGSWDRNDTTLECTPGVCANARFAVSLAPSTSIYDVEIIPVTGLEVRQVALSFPSLTAAQLADLKLTLPGYFSYELVASSTPGGEEDIRATLAGGGNPIPPEGVVTLDLIQTLPTGDEVTLGSGTMTGEVALEPARNVEVCRCGPNHENVNVTWSSGPGLRYSLQRSTNLIDWVDVPGMTNMEAAGTLMSRTEVGAGEGKQQLFYRIISQLPQAP